MEELYEDYLYLCRHDIEQRLDQLISPSSNLQGKLFESARYSLLGKAKRLRPLLALVTAEGFGMKREDCLTPCCTLEMIHTYSLIHDDLPSMDNDDLRRGKPTCHKVYGEALAILTGDFLLTYPFELLTTAPHLSDTTKVALIHTLAKKSGAQGMLGGQVVDILYEGKELNQSILEFIHDHKTAALISASLEFGAILARQPNDVIQTLSTAGKEIGLAFQIIDDILDVTGTEQELGKPLQSDIKNNKQTAISLLGVRKANELAEKLLTQAKNRCKSLNLQTSYLEKIFDQMIYRKF